MSDLTQVGWTIIIIVILFSWLMIVSILAYIHTMGSGKCCWPYLFHQTDDADVMGLLFFAVQVIIIHTHTHTHTFFCLLYIFFSFWLLCFLVLQVFAFDWPCTHAPHTQQSNFLFFCCDFFFFLLLKSKKKVATTNLYGRIGLQILGTDKRKIKKSKNKIWKLTHTQPKWWTVLWCVCAFVCL